MRKLKITDAMLKRLDACYWHRAIFVSMFPDGVTITDDQETNFPIVVKAMSHGTTKLPPGHDHELWGYDDCAHGPLNVAWLIAALLKACGRYGLDLADALEPEPEPNDRIWCLARNDRSGGEFALAGLLADAVGIYLARKGDAS